MKRKLSAKLGAIALAGALALSGLSATAASAAPKPGPIKTTGSVKPGSNVGVSGGGCKGGTFTLGTKGVKVGSTGSWNTSVKAPSQAGTYQVTGVCDAYGKKYTYVGTYTVLPVVTKATVKAAGKGKAKFTVSFNTNKNIKVKVYAGKKLFKTVTLKKGKGSITVTKLKKGKHTIKVVYGKISKSASVRVK